MIKKYFKNLPLSLRLILLVASLLTIIFIIIGTYIYTTNKSELLRHNEQSINNHLEELNSILENEYQQTKSIVTAAENISGFLLKTYDIGTLEDTSFYPIDATVLKDSIHHLISKQEDDPFLSLKTDFYKKKYMDNGYALLLSKNGHFIIHPHHEGKNISNTSFFRNIIRHNKATTSQLEFNFPEKDKTQKILFYRYHQPFEAYTGIVIFKEDLYSTLYKIRNTLIITFIISLAIFILPLFFFADRIDKDFHHIIAVLNDLSKGSRVEKIEHQRSDEVGMILDNLNKMIAYIKRNCSFSNELGKGNLDTAFEPLSKADELGNALLEMRENFKAAEIENKKQKVIEEERSWIAQGLAKFAEILRKDNDDLETLSYNVISNLVKYLDALQGGLFVVEKNEDSPFLEMKACFAYDRRKYLEKQIPPGEGLVGMCYKEQKTIYITDVPEGYFDISSGLGDTDPGSILIVPVKLNDKVYGCIEIAALTEIEKYKIEFVEKVSENIASTISSVRMNMETNRLLEKSQHQSEEMKNQEEELRQNMEELKATQEEAQRRENELKETLFAINKAIGTLELDMQGNILDANKFYMDMTGQTIAELKGRNLSEFLNDTNENPFSAILNALSTGQSHIGKNEYIFNKKKKHLYESFTSIRNNDGVFSKIMVMSYDLSEIKKIC